MSAAATRRPDASEPTRIARIGQALRAAAPWTAMATVCLAAQALGAWALFDGAWLPPGPAWWVVLGSALVVAATVTTGLLVASRVRDRQWDAIVSGLIPASALLATTSMVIALPLDSETGWFEVAWFLLALQIMSPGSFLAWVLGILLLVRSARPESSPATTPPSTHRCWETA